MAKPWEKYAPAVPEAGDPAVAAPASGPWQKYQQPGWIERQWTGFKNFVSGADRTEFPDLPELIGLLPTAYESASGKTGEGKFKLDPATTDALMTGMAVAQDVDQQRDILAKNLPGATFSEDKFGNPIVEFQGKRAYINAPGLSMQDITQATTFGALAAATGGQGAALGGVPASLGGRMLVGGAVAGGTSAGEDVAAHAVGAEKVIDPLRVGGIALLGAAAEGLAPAVRGIYRTLFKQPALYNAQSGQLTPAGIQALQKAGAAPDQISDDLAREFARLADDAASPDDALRLAQGRSLPVPVQQTQGQLTGEPARQMTEDMLLKGAYGQGASTQMRGIVANQQDQLRANIPAIQQRIAGQPLGPGEGAATAQQALVAQRQAGQAAVTAGYDAARAASAEVPRSMVHAGARAIADAVKADHILKGLPRTASVLDDLTGILAQTGDDPMAGVNVNALFDWRKRATAAAQAGGEEATAIRKAIGAFDDWIGQSVDDALLRGDQAAVDLWKKAIAGYREFAGKFKGGDLIEALTVQAPRSGQYQLVVDPADAANYIFGASRSGLYPKANLTRDLSRMKGLLGADSEAWKALKQEAFLRFAAAGEGAFEGGTRMFSGAGFKRAWEESWRRTPDLMKGLFSDADKRLIDQFAEVASRVTTPVRGGQNFSNTTPAALNAVQNFWRWLVSGPQGAAVLTRFPGLGAIMAGARTQQAVIAGRQVIPRLGITPGVTAGTLTPPAQGLTTWMREDDQPR